MTFTLLPDVSPSKAGLAKTRLLEAGLKCFSSRGLEGVTIREIAKESGQNSAAITYYFNGKEGLYQAVLGAVMRFFKSHVHAAETACALAQANGGLTPRRALALLKQIQRTFALGMLNDRKAAQFAMLMVREQTQPSAAFDSLYADTIEPLHRMFSVLLGTVTGDDPQSSRTVLRAHALIGQLQVFVMARETLLRRMGWADYGDDRAEQVADMLAENFDIYLAGLQARTTTPQADTHV